MVKAFKDTNTSSENDPGNCLTQNYNGRVYRLRWSDINRIRPTGEPTADMMGMMPWRFGPDDDNFSKFFIRLAIFRGGTARRVTFFTALADPDNAGEQLDIDVHQPPICRFYEKVKQLSYGDPQLKVTMMEGGNNRAAPLPNPHKHHGLMQGIVMRQDRNNASRIIPMHPCIIVLTSSALGAATALLNQQVEGYTGDPNDYAQRFVAGRILDPDNGSMLKLYNPKNTAAGGQQATVDWNQAGQQQQQGGQVEVSQYTCELGEPLPLPRLPDGRLKMAVEGTLWTPWETALRFLSEREQFDLVVSAFEDHPVLLCQVFSDKRDWLPDHVKQAAAEMQAQAQSLAVPPLPGSVINGGQQVQIQQPQVPVVPTQPAAPVAAGTGQVPAPPAPQQQVGGAVVDWAAAEATTPAAPAGPTQQMGPEAFAAATTEAPQVPAAGQGAVPPQASAAPPVPEATPPAQAAPAAPVTQPAAPAAPVAQPAAPAPAPAAQQPPERVQQAMQKLDEVKAQQQQQQG